ncbi:MAG: ATP-binding protein [Chloroflexota bacterium]
MEESKRQQFQIHLPGLLKVLAENLYSSKKVAVRELLQNSHDSCVRRSAEGNERGYRPRVEVSVDPERRVLTISDNGSGLSTEEVTEYLSTIGRSYTRELGEKLSVLSPDEASQLIGQFGLGFLSAFLVASEVTLTTKSMKEGSQALRWRSTGDVHYDIAPGERDAIGTTVELKVKPSASFMLNSELLVETIQQYADFLPIPIYMAGDNMPINLMTPPWDAIDRQTAMLDYIGRVFKMSEPLAIIQLHDQTIDLGHDEITIPLQGFLFVPSHSVASVHEYGDLAVYIRRMFICEHQRDLLPPWARFVRGVIDCPYLQPTASREEIHQEDMFGSVQQALEQQLVAGLRNIAETEPTVWKRIVQGHSDVITGWAVRDNEFFAQVADIVTFRTSRGLLSLPEYLKLTNGTVYYVTRELGSLQEQLLGEGRGVPVVDASWFSVTAFLQKYADFKQDIQLVQLDGESKQLLRPVDADPYLALMDFYRKLGIRVRVVTFKPEEVPALVIYPKDAEFITESRNALDQGMLPGPLAGLVSDYIDKMKTSDEDDIRGTLYLNASCALIKQLAETPPAEATRDSVLTLIYQVARLFAGRTLTPTDVKAAFGETIKALEALASK